MDAKTVETKTQAIARVLEVVPVPIVSQVAKALDLVLTAIEAEQQATGGVNVTEWRAALEPWQSIAATARQQLGVVTDATGQTFPATD